MGIRDLWPLLDSVKERTLLTELAGQTVAIDLGFWVCQMQTAAHVSPLVHKIYLRNLYFRTVALIEHGIHVMFVADGKPPQLKADTIRRRLNQPTLVDLNGRKQMPVNRSKFTRCMKECAELIRTMGLPVFELDGEAEAVCAVLNRDENVDAVITDDGDAFLYGARVVLRNFSVDGKQPSVDVYRMSRIETEIGLDRYKLVCFALLIGCDFDAKGVAGVGRETAMRFLTKCIDGVDCLNRMRKWRFGQLTDDRIESSIIRRIDNIDTFPDERIVDEFLRERDVPTVANNFIWHLPNLPRFQKFMSTHLQWTDEYCVAKLVPLMTLWTLRRRIDDKFDKQQPSMILSPVGIVKRRVRCGQPCFEVQWKKIATDTTTICNHYITLEREHLLTSAFPRLMMQFEEDENCKKHKRRPRKTGRTAAPVVTVNLYLIAVLIFEEIEKTEEEDQQRLDDSVILIEDEVDELEQFSTSFLNDVAVFDVSSLDCSLQQIAAELDETIENESITIVDINTSPLPLMQRIQQHRRDRFE